MHADVDDHPDGAQHLLVEEAEAVGGVGEEAQVVHESFGVQGPALDVGADRAQRGLVAAEPVGEGDPPGELEVVAGDALVVPGGDELPGREGVPAEGRQVGASGAAEVQAGGGVVRGRAAAGRCDPGLDVAQLSGDVEVGAVEGCYRLVHELLQPVADRLLALDRVAVPLQVVHGAAHSRSGQHAFGFGAHLGRRPVELGPGPCVGLVQVEVGARVVACGDQVALPAHGVGGVGGGRGVGVAQPVAELGDGGGGLEGGGAQFAAQALGAGGDEVGEPSRGAGALAGPGGELVDHGGCLAGRGEQAAGDPLGERGAVPVERAGQVAQPPGDRRPVVVGGGRPQGEDVPHLVDVPGDVAQLTEVLAGVVQGEFGGEALPEQPGAGPVGGVLGGRVLGGGGGGGGVERGEGVPGDVGEGVEPLRGEVRLPVVARVQAQPGGLQRVVCGHLVEVAVGDGAWGDRFGCHAAILAHRPLVHSPRIGTVRHARQ